LAAFAALIVALPVRAQNVRPVVESIASSWSRADAGSIAGIASRDGVSVQIGGDKKGILKPNQVAAVLREVFDGSETVSARTDRVGAMGGTRQRAFGEISWTARVRGTTNPQRSTVFLALVHEDDGWRISEIRLMK
jgi:hypothetical protein